MKRIVLDTNVWVSGFIIPDRKPASIVRASIRGNVHGIISDYILMEIERTLRRPKLMNKYRIHRKEIVSFLLTLQRRLEIVRPFELDIEIRDPMDLPILGTALAGHATHIVTGDRDMLDDENLKAWMLSRGIEIISPASFQF